MTTTKWRYFSQLADFVKQKGAGYADTKIKHWLSRQDASYIAPNPFCNLRWTVGQGTLQFAKQAAGLEECGTHPVLPVFVWRWILAFKYLN